MPVTVVVRSASGGASPSLTFDGARVVIGRSDGCDVRLPDPSISLRHASIRQNGPEYTLVDEGSTNGTWVGGVRLGPQTPRIVRTGDLVRVGRVWLELAIGHRAPTPDLGLATKDLALALVRGAMEAVGDDTRVRVRVAEGPDLGEELVLVDEGRSYVLGRAEKCDLPLADEDASREHAAITRRGAQVLVRDLGSRNGVFIGDQRIPAERDVPWRSPIMMRIGQTVLALDEPVTQALSEIEGADDEKLPEAEAPPPPPSQAAPPPASAGAPAPASAGAPPSAAPASAAPIAARPPSVAPVASSKSKRRWVVADFFVVGIAVAVIGASIAGLYWVLR